MPRIDFDAAATASRMASSDDVGELPITSITFVTPIYAAAPA
jgi:hypothetical protein